MSSQLIWGSVPLGRISMDLAVVVAAVDVCGVCEVVVPEEGVGVVDVTGGLVEGTGCVPEDGRSDEVTGPVCGVVPEVAVLLPVCGAVTGSLPSDDDTDEDAVPVSVWVPTPGSVPVSDVAAVAVVVSEALVVTSEVVMPGSVPFGFSVVSSDVSPEQANSRRALSSRANNGAKRDIGCLFMG